MGPKGAAAGAALGAAVGGPVGAVIGGITGWIGGDIVGGESSDSHDDQPGRTGGDIEGVADYGDSDD